MSDFGEGRNVKGRKDHRCEWCGQLIPKGERHYNYQGMWEGEWQNWRMHEECHGDYEINCDPDGFSPFGNERPEEQRRGPVPHGTKGL